MHIRCGYDIVYDCPNPTAILLLLGVRPERLPDLVTPQVIGIDPDVPRREFIDGFGNVCTRIVALHRRFRHRRLRPAG
jgi:hypothetical protein